MPRLLFVTVLAMILPFFACQSSDGQLIFDFNQTSTGGVRVTASGSGTVTANRNTETWEILDFDNDFLNDAIGTFAAIEADSVSGTLTSSGGVSASVTGFSVNRSATSNDDLIWTTASKVKFRHNQSYTFNLVAVFDSTTLSFTDLIEGLYTDAGGSSASEIFGSTTVNVSAVPEPKHLLFLISGFSAAGLVITLRKRRRNICQTGAHQGDSTLLT